MRKLVYLFILFALLSAAPVAHGQSISTSSFGEEPAVIWLPLVTTQTAKYVTPPDWTGKNGGFTCLAADPANPKIIYTGTWGGGIFRSEDQGETWTWASYGIEDFFIDALAVDPVDGRILYASTHAGGLYRSNDRGKNWFPAQNGIQAGVVIYSIAVHPVNHEVLYAGTRKTGNGLDIPYNGVLYKSTNSGASWYPVFDDIGGPEVKDWVYSIAIKTNPDRVLIATHEHGPYFSATGEAGSWQSAPVNTGFGDYAKGRAIAFDPRPGSTAAFYATWHGGFYRSGDNGSTWGHGPEPLENSKVYPNALAVAGKATDVVYLGTFENREGVFKSTNSGHSWASMGLDDESIYAVLAPSDGNVVFVGTVGGGLYRSTDGGKTWLHSMKGIEIHPSADVAAAVAKPVPPTPAEEMLNLP